jgi:hypothetical protein
MKRLLTLIVALISFSAWAGESFVAKDYQHEGLVQKFRTTVSIPFTELFDYPDAVPTTADFNDAAYGVSYEFDFFEEDTPLSLYKCEYSNKSFRAHIYMASRRYGTFRFRVRVTYNGETAESTVSIKTRAVLPQDDEIAVAPGKEVVIDPLLNDNFAETSQKKDLALLSLDKVTVKPEAGELALTEVDGRPAFIYTCNRDAMTFSEDSFSYYYEVAYGDVMERVDATCRIDVHGKMYATRVIDFLPAPGQFTNTFNFGMADRETQEAQTCNGKGMGLSLGSFGGYIIFGFDQPIYNNPQNPYGVDFTVLGNAFTGDLYGQWSEAASVQVMEDKNGNGIPDDGEWYELAGSDYWLSSTVRNLEMTYYNPGYNRRYTVPFTTNTDLCGAVMTNHFHEQPYYPDPFEFGCDRDKITFSGNMIQSCPDKRAPSYIEFYRCPAFGYADNHPSSSADPTIPSNPYYADGKGAVQDGFDLSWAVDKDGNHVDLEKVDFVKVYNAGWANLGWLGEWSAECLGVAISRPDPEYVAEDYYLNYIGITQLLVPTGKEVRFEGLAFRNGRPIDDGVKEWWVPEEYAGIISVDADGVVKGLQPGEAKLCFRQTDKAPADTIDLQVCDINKVIIDQEGNTGVASNTRTELIVGEMVYINAEDEFATDEVLNGQRRNRYAYEQYEWESSDPGVGTINNGLFTGLKEGETVVTVRSRIKPELYAEMLMVVNPVPEVVQGAESFGVAANEPKGSFSNAELFETGIDATVYITSVRPTTVSPEWIYQDGNALGYSFMPDEFTADDVVVGWEFRGTEGEFTYKVRYDSDITQSGADGQMNMAVREGEWSTLCLPYTISGVRNITMYSVMGHDPSYTRLLLEPIGDTLEAGRPCIYYANASTMRAAIGEDTVDEATDENGLHGTFADVTLPSGACRVAAGIVTDSPGWVVKSGLAYVQISEVPEVADYNPSMPYMDLKTTASAGDVIYDIPDDAIYYDMMGRRLDAPQKGVNIIRLPNGVTRKVYVR